MSHADDFIKIFQTDASRPANALETLQHIATCCNESQCSIHIKTILNAQNKNAIVFLLNHLHLFPVSITADTIRLVIEEMDTEEFNTDVMTAFEKLPRTERIALGLTLLKNKIPHTPVLILLIKSVDQTGVFADPRPLIELLSVYTEKNVIKTCVDILRKSKDDRIVPAIISCCTNSNTDQAILPYLLTVCGELSKRFTVPVSLFLSHLRHSDPNVRHACVRSIAQYRKKQLFKKLIKTFATEKSSLVRNEIIRQMKYFPHHYTVSFLFHLLYTSDDSNEQLLSESSLHALPNTCKYPVFKKKLQSDNPHIRAIACKQIAVLQNQSDAALLVSVLKNDPDENVRVQAAEALNFYESRELDHILYECMQRDSAVAYSAVLSICKSFNSDKQDLFIQILHNLHEEDALIEQTVLSYLPNHFKIYKVHPSMIAALQEKIYNTNATIRYLAIRTLGETNDKTVVQPLLSCLEKESVAEVRSACIEAIQKLLGNEYTFLLDMISAAPHTFMIVTEIIYGLDIPSLRRTAVIQHLFRFSIQLQCKDTFINAIMHYQYKESDIYAYLSVIIESQCEESFIITLVDFLAQHTATECDPSSTALLFTLYDCSSVTVRKKLHPLLYRCHDSTTAIFDRYCTENDAALKSGLHAILLSLSQEH